MIATDRTTDHTTDHGSPGALSIEGYAQAQERALLWKLLLMVRVIRVFGASLEGKGKGMTTDDALKAIEIIRREHPKLSSNGFAGRRSLDDYHEGSRRTMTSKSSVDQFIQARRFLSDPEIAKHRTKACTSLSTYGWKHVAERWAGTYISNGMFIAAALSLGFTVKQTPESPNGTMNLGRKAFGGPV